MSPLVLALALFCAAVPVREPLPRGRVIAREVGGCDAFPKVGTVLSAVPDAPAYDERFRDARLDARIASAEALLVQDALLLKAAGDAVGEVEVAAALKGRVEVAEPLSGVSVETGAVDVAVFGPVCGDAVSRGGVAEVEMLAPGGGGQVVAGDLSGDLFGLLGMGPAGLGELVSYGGLGAASATDTNAPAVFVMPAGSKAVADVSVVSTVPSVRRQAFDRMLGPIDVWGGGMLGELGKKANQAAERGDTVEYQRLAAEYWKLLNEATERRRVLGERSNRVKVQAGR